MSHDNLVQIAYCAHSICRTFEARASIEQKIIELTTWNVFMRRIFFFSRKNLLLCDFQGNNYGLLVKTIKKIPNSPICTASRTSSHFCQAPNFQSELSEPFEWTLIELGFNMIENLLCLGFSSLCLWFWYVLFLKAFVIYARHFEYSRMRLFCYMFDWKQPAQRLKLRKKLLTISEIYIIRWNMYRDNNFHSRR